ncbi:MAG: hypothetical protein NW208_08480 [Bryobacter sp.]|nr:hypothetical protein [Bryobacter sp.]
MSSPARTFKRTTIYIARGKDTWIYDSPEAIPALLRKQLLRSTRGMNSATILIADRGGREEIRKLLEGEPNALDNSLRIAVGPAAPFEGPKNLTATLRPAAPPSAAPPPAALPLSRFDLLFPLLLFVLFFLLINLDFFR